VIPLLIVIVTLALFGAGLALGLRHQRKYQEQVRRETPPQPPSPEQLAFAAAVEKARRVVFDPQDAVDVTEAELAANPTAWHAQSIRVTGHWEHQFEGSWLAGAWVHPPAGMEIPYGQYRARAEGVWVFPRPVGSAGGLPGFSA